MRIHEDDLKSGEILSLLAEHLEEMHEITPPESVHALDSDALLAPEITFWSAWEGGELLGCGALKALSPRSGEIKSMRTVAAHRGKGVASRLLEHILAQAEERAYLSLSLETGAMLEFAPARALYAKYGFEVCGPFADYGDDPNSVFMTKTLPLASRLER